jgi:tRNA(Ile)-lysidine synthase
MRSEPRLDTALERPLADALDLAGLSAPGTRLVAAVSGGADSVAMLRALAAAAPVLGLEFSVAHLDHGIRPEAGADADFVQDLCNRIGLDLDREQVDVPTAARAAHRSLEMQARTMRYAFFKRVSRRRHADAVLTAHTLDDQAETLLLNLCRGAGPAALGGIPPDSVILGVRVVRPLLNVSRRAIEDYLHAAGQPWREDATNRDTSYRRNAVRHRVLPLLGETLNPRVPAALARAATLLRDDNALLDTLATAAFTRLRQTTGATGDALPLAPFRALHPALRRRLLAQWLREAGVAPERLRFDWIERLDTLARDDAGGGRIRLAAGLEIWHEYDRLRCRPAAAVTPAASETVLAIPGITPLPAFGCHADVRVDKGFSREPSAPPGTIPAQVHLRHDPGSEPFILSVRTWEPGDRIGMLGMEGTRKVQDILTDAKIPAPQRDRIPVFCVNGAVAWIPGCRPARHLAVPDPGAPSLCLRVF